MFPYGLGYLLYSRNSCSVANPHFHLRISSRCTPVGQDSLYRLRGYTRFPTGFPYSKKNVGFPVSRWCDPGDEPEKGL